MPKARSTHLMKIDALFNSKDSSCSTKFWQTLASRTSSSGGETWRRIYRGIVLFFSWYSWPVFKVVDVIIAVKYSYLLSKFMLPHSRNRFGSDWIFIHHNNQRFSARTTKSWVVGNHVNVLQWPAQTPAWITSNISEKSLIKGSGNRIAQKNWPIHRQWVREGRTSNGSPFRFIDSMLQRWYAVITGFLIKKSYFKWMNTFFFSAQKVEENSKNESMLQNHIQTYYIKIKNKFFLKEKHLGKLWAPFFPTVY